MPNDILTGSIQSYGLLFLLSAGVFFTLYFGWKVLRVTFNALYCLRDSIDAKMGW